MQTISKLAYILPFIGSRISAKQQQNKLLIEIEETKYMLNSVRNAFDIITDADLIDSCIYQLESLEVKYNYLLKQARIAGLKYSALVGEEEWRNDANVNSMEHCNSDGAHHVLVLQKYRKTV